MLQSVSVSCRICVTFSPAWLHKAKRKYTKIRMTPRTAYKAQSIKRGYRGRWTALTLPRDI
jgi:hypothetical protein